MEILIDNLQILSEIDLEDLQTKTRQVLEELDCNEQTVLSIAFVDREEMRQLNEQYTGKSSPTNVLSFAQHEGEALGASDLNVLGDVVICAEVAREQAIGLGYTVQEMVIYLLIHGILHLSGLHHNDLVQEQSMEAKLNEIFGKLFPS